MTSKAIHRCIPVILFCLLYWANALSAAAPDVKSVDPPRNILFIGNSFTFYNNGLHTALRNLIDSADLGHGFPGNIKIMTISGAKLADHAPALKAIVNSVKWDVVVLQGHSLEAVDKNSIKSFQRAARAFDEVIDESGADTVFFMTWAREDYADFTESLNLHYTLIGNRTGSLVVPVGLAFARIKNEHADIDLIRSDGRHPTMAGTYLAACVFFAALYQKSPEGLVFPRATTLDESRATILQRGAWQTVQDYYTQER